MWKKLVLAVGLLLLLVVGGGISYLNLAFPKVAAARDHKVAPTPERVARGEYLAHHVVGCIACHSTRDETRFASPIVAGTEGSGGEKFTPTYGFPGTFYARNITPKGIGDWTDGELERLITTGVTKDGRAMFPVMPYKNFASLCQDDVDAVIAYIRTLKPIDSDWPTAKLDFPVNLIVKTFPEDSPRPPCPDRSNALEYGKYLVTVASCQECHTPKGPDHKSLPGMEFGGGMVIAFPTGTLTSANISTDTETGIGSWTKATFLARLQAHANGDEPVLKPGDMRTIMPWTIFGGMTTEDLSAIFDYLHTVKPVKNSPPRWTPK